MKLPMFVQAACWGLLAGSGLLIGAVVAVAFGGRLPHRMIAAVMGFGGGVLIAVLSVDLMDSAFEDGGPIAATFGFLFGAAAFSAINWRLAQHGARHRNRCGDCVEQPSEAEHKGSGLAIAVGAVLDGVPESLVIGLSLLGGGKIGLGLVAGFFLANVPQGLSSASGMKKAGRSSRYIFSLWAGILLSSGMAAAAGYLVLGTAAPALPATILAFAAGGVLAMLAESMIPEAFADAQPFIGLITVVGFLVAFLIIKMHA
ncbi:zinc/iron permease [Sorangium cellulosum]|uniref:Zinc/iron permease n=1 Tax=Sorangium cellulosum TaxID=56 RepID=A0A2L0EI58_SORCE|nr:ZIP family zinc transporter [Sorangium cellulosum]AUX38978.1 zinc/iron permease [Sorangium cellulosum]